MALDSEYWDTKDESIDGNMDEVGALLVNLYADYCRYIGSVNDDYAKAVSIAIRMLSD